MASSGARYVSVKFDVFPADMRDLKTCGSRDAGRLLPLDFGSKGFTIGRRPTSSLHYDDPTISGTHCRVFLRGHDVWVEDCSSNGTFVNNAKIGKGQQAVFPDGAILSLLRTPQHEPAPYAYQLLPEKESKTAPRTPTPEEEEPSVAERTSVDGGHFYSCVRLGVVGSSAQPHVSG